MFDNLKALGSIMKNAGDIREKAEQLKAQLEARTVEAEAGGGAVRVTLNGKGRVLRVELDPPLLSGIAGDDRGVIEELIAAAVNAGQEKVRRLMADELKQLTGGMDIPGLSGLIDQANL